MTVESSVSLKAPKSRIISKVLSPAIQIWLRSQVEQVESLQFQIVGGDRQILSGYIPKVSIAASRAVYQGLHLSQLQLEGTEIQVNLGQVIKGKPLRLLEPIPVEGQLLLTEKDLQTSLQAPLLSTALTELLSTFLQTNGITQSANDLKERKISWQQVDIDEGQLKLCGTLTDVTHQTTPVVIYAGLQLATPQVLKLHPLQIHLSPTSSPFHLDGFQIDLGSEVDLQELALMPGQLMCRGRLKVLP